MKSTRTLSSRHFRRAILATLAAASLPLASIPSRAADPRPSEQRNSQTVHYGDLNLHSHQGLAALYQRLVAAARVVCDDSSHVQSLDDWSRARDCTSQSMARAVAAVGIPELTAMYARKTGLGVHPILVTRR